MTPAQKQVYLSSVYGRQPYHPQRTTSKAPYLHYQSPVNPKTAAIMAGLMTGERGVTSKPVLQDISSVPEKEVAEPRKKTAHVARPLRSSQGQPTSHKDSAQYYFHPRVDLIVPEEGRVAAPLEGQLVPMAIPLGKPKTDPALRPPIATKDVKPTSSQLEGSICCIASLNLYLAVSTVIDCLTHCHTRCYLRPLSQMSKSAVSTAVS